MWDLSSLTRDQTHAPEVEAWSLKHWAIKELPRAQIFNSCLVVFVPVLLMYNLQYHIF